MRRLVVRPSAVADLDAIADHTVLHWGEARQDAYVGRLLDAFEQIEKTPDIGALRPGLSRDWHGYAVGRHVIFYLLDCDTIEIVRVLHQSMDVSRHLP